MVAVNPTVASCRCTMSMVTVIALFLLYFISKIEGQSNDVQQDNRTQLHLLNIMPFPDRRPDAGWDRAYELIPAAELAVDQINNISDFLPGYKLNLFHIDTEACGISTITKGLINTYVGFLDPKQPLNVVALTGLFCSSVTDIITRILRNPNFTFVQMAGSTATIHRNATQYPSLIHLISSFSAYNNAVFGMMRQFGWRKITVVHDSLGVFFTTSAAEFVQKTSNSMEFNPAPAIPVTANTVTQVHQILVSSMARIVFFIGTVPESVKFMCSAYKTNALYPGFVYIFHDRRVYDFVSNVNITSCTETEILKAIEGVFFIEYSLTADKETELVSNQTYEEYYEDYLKRLMKLESAKNVTLDRSNIYANSMYDQVWAFALGLKASLDSNQGIDLVNLALKDPGSLANILRNNIINVSFQGASGFVKFDNSGSHQTIIKIFQNIDGSEELVGLYNPNKSKITLVRKMDPPVPSDVFEMKPRLLPLWLSGLFFGIISACQLLLFGLETFAIAFRKRPEMKASNLYFNIMIFAGCFLLFLAAEMRTVGRGVIIANSTVFTVICNIEIWSGSTGLSLIFATLLMRMLRISHIFRTYGKVGKFWKDKYMILAIFIITSGGIVILLVWTIVDKIRRTETLVYISDSDPPFFESRVVCSCMNLAVWLTAAFAYNGIIIVAVVLLAIKTRKIKLSNFKDTKVVNAYIFVTVLVVCTVMPMWFVIEREVDNYVAGHVILGSGFTLIGGACLIFLFLQRVYVTIRNIKREKKNKKKGLPLRKREMQFSKH